MRQVTEQQAVFTAIKLEINQKEVPGTLTLFALILHKYNSMTYRFNSKRCKLISIIYIIKKLEAI